MVADADDRSSVRHRVPNVATGGGGPRDLRRRARCGTCRADAFDGSTYRLVTYHATDPSTGATTRVDSPRPSLRCSPRTTGVWLSLRVWRWWRWTVMEGGTCGRALPRGADERLNDGACDRNGRLWMGTIPVPATGARTGALWRIDDGGRPRTARRTRGWPTAWAGVPTDAGLPRRHPVGASTSIEVSRATSSIADSSSISATCRAFPTDSPSTHNGDVWVAMAGGGSLRCYAPDGSLQVVLDLPVRHPTSCCFGGSRPRPAVRDHRHRRPDRGDRPTPWDGRLLRVDAEVVGLPPVPLRRRASGGRRRNVYARPGSHV